MDSLPPGNPAGDPRVAKTALFWIADALEVGDYQAAADIVLSLIEDTGPRVERAWCPRCHAGFEWGGLADAHVRWCVAEERAA